MKWCYIKFGTGMVLCRSDWHRNVLCRYGAVRLSVVAFSKGDGEVIHCNDPSCSGHV